MQVSSGTKPYLEGLLKEHLIAEAAAQKAIDSKKAAIQPIKTTPEIKVPSISSVSSQIFINIGAKTVVNFQYPLASKTETLKDVVAKLKDAKEHKIRNRLFGLLK